MERTKDPRGLAPRSASAPVARPRTPLRGTLPGSLSAKPARVVQLIDSASAPLPLAGNMGTAVQLDRESAPVATSRSSWTVVAGGYYPPLRKAFGFFRADGDIRPYPHLFVGAGVLTGPLFSSVKQHNKSQMGPEGAKRSFAGSSLPSFLSRKRGRGDYLESRLEKSLFMRSPELWMSWSMDW